ncbi:MAG TPA: MFS transporter [Steroidobacteraceae bacterium]|nr:MFS transporter [Steroidobacteraceae bacterium]
MSGRRLEGLLTRGTQILPQERRAVMLAFACNFMVLASYYILKPVRDTIATDYNDQLQLLFTGTFIGTIIASPIYAWLAARVRLNRLLPGVFWFWLVNVVLFQVLFKLDPGNRWIGGAYYVWFSVVNLFMISVFWTLVSDVFSATQATRLFGLIAAGGSTGAIVGPLIVRLFVHAIGLNAMLSIAAAGFIVVIALVHMLMREKTRLQRDGAAFQPTTLDHELAGHAFDGFWELLRSAYSRHQAAFILLMTWVNTVGYFLQTDVIAHAFSAQASRAVAVADISLVVNILAAIILLFGLGRYVHRFGVTAGLILNPIIMVVAFVGLALSPTLLMIQALQVIRQVSQYAIARPTREICFTVVPQADRYKTKNVIDTVVYRFGDLSAAWMEAGLRLAGLRVIGSAVAGFGISVIWGVGALALGRRFEERRARQQADLGAARAAQV